MVVVGERIALPQHRAPAAYPVTHQQGVNRGRPMAAPMGEQPETFEVPGVCVKFSRPLSRPLIIPEVRAQLSAAHISHPQRKV